MNILSLRGISQVLLGNKVLQGKFEKGHVVSIYIKVDLNNFLKAFNYKMFFNCQVLHLGSISLFFFFFLRKTIPDQGYFLTTYGMGNIY